MYHLQYHQYHLQNQHAMLLSMDAPLHQVEIFCPVHHLKHVYI